MFAVSEANSMRSMSGRVENTQTWHSDSGSVGAHCNDINPGSCGRVSQLASTKEASCTFSIPTSYQTLLCPHMCLAKRLTCSERSRNGFRGDIRLYCD